MSTAQAAAALKAIAGTHEGPEPPDIYQVFADFSTKFIGDDRAGWLGLAGMVSSDPLATDMFLAKAAGIMDKENDFKAWGYRKAVEYVGARKSEQRRRSLVESYRVDWGHQASRDGIALALWGIGGGRIVNPTGYADVPGPAARAAEFKCGRQAYARVRQEIEDRTVDAVTEAAYWLEMCRNGNFSSEFIRRWEAKTGARWADAER